MNKCIKLVIVFSLLLLTGCENNILTNEAFPLTRDEFVDNFMNDLGEKGYDMEIAETLIDTQEELKLVLTDYKTFIRIAINMDESFLNVQNIVMSGRNDDAFKMGMRSALKILTAHRVNESELEETIFSEYNYSYYANGNIQRVYFRDIMCTLDVDGRDFLIFTISKKWIYDSEVPQASPH